MGDVVWVNGEFLDRADARVSAFDAGLLHGVGLFETMTAARGRVLMLDRHLARLDRSARELGLSESLRVDALADAVGRVLDESRLGALGQDDGSGGEPPRARVRLTITGGDLNLLERRAQSQTDPTIVISVTPATRYPAEMFEKGVGVHIAAPKANPLNPFEGHKTLDYWWRLRALQEAAAKRMGEALILQVTNHICGGAVSNLFAVRDGTLMTPLARGEEEPGAVGSPVLPGVTRGAIIEMAERIGVGCARKLMNIADVLDADELFLTNASWGVLPVVGVEAKPLADGRPGLLTRKLREMWLDRLAGAGA